ncbi:hypothetical protein DUHN55_23990 [Helicobacter pylori]
MWAAMPGWVLMSPVSHPDLWARWTGRTTTKGADRHLGDGQPPSIGRARAVSVPGTYPDITP